ncbi:TPA: hypothetical protein ACIBH9_001582 [Salmonella enterica subsp. diarizonae serovar 61:l,v:z35]
MSRQTKFTIVLNSEYGHSVVQIKSATLDTAVEKAKTQMLDPDESLEDEDIIKKYNFHVVAVFTGVREWLI